MQDADLVIAEGGITVTIPIEVIEDLFDEENHEPITVTITVTPCDIDMCIAEDGGLLVVEIYISVGCEPVTEITAAITAAVSLEGFDLYGKTPTGLLPYARTADCLAANLTAKQKYSCLKHKPPGFSM